VSSRSSPDSSHRSPASHCPTLNSRLLFRLSIL
jgi:hypothetical protein